MKQITAKDLEEYKAHRAACSLVNGNRIQKSTVNRELDLLKSLLARAVEWGYLRATPAQGVRKFRIDEKEPVFLTAPQGAAVLQTAVGQMKGFIAVGLNAGLRKGEMFDLKWEDPDSGSRPEGDGGCGSKGCGFCNDYRLHLFNLTPPSM